MYLSPVDELRLDLGFDDMPDITDAVQGALNAAEALLAARLGTEFAYGTFTDTFWVPEPGFTDQGRPITEFRLTRGFVSAVTSASLVLEVADFAIPDNVTDQLSYLTSKLELGVLVDYQTLYSLQYLQVAYTAGFQADGTDTDMYVQASVPTWLKQASFLQAKMLLSDSPPVKNANIIIDTRTIGAHLQALVAKHVRYTPVALLPL